MCPHGERGRFCCGYAARGMPCPFPRSPVVRFVPAQVFGVGLIEEVGRLQRAVNAEREAMTPRERAEAAREQLRYIGSVEPGMAWVLDALEPRPPLWVVRADCHALGGKGSNRREATMASSRAAPAAKKKGKGRAAPEPTAQVTLRGRFAPGTRVRLYAVAGPEVLRHEGGELLCVKRTGEDATVQFTDLDGVAVGGRYIVHGHVNGQPLDVRVRGRVPGDETGQGLAPVGNDVVRHGDGTVAGIRGQIKAGDPTSKPAVPPHPDPSVEGFQRPSLPVTVEQPNAEPFPEVRPAVPFHPEPGGEG